MLKPWVIIAVLVLSSPLCAQKADPESVHINPQIQAEFIYGPDEMSSFIANNIIVPKTARYYGINGDVKLKFNVDHAGEINEIEILQEDIDLGVALKATENSGVEDFSGFFSKEAVRVVSLMSGLFTPAMDSGKYVSSIQVITVIFRTKQYEDNERDYRVLKGNRNVRDFKWQFGTYTKEEPDYAKDRYNVGVYKLQSRMPEIASRYFEEAIRFDGDYMDAYYNLGIAYKQLSKMDQACKMWVRAQQLGDPEAGFLLDDYCNGQSGKER